MVFKKPFAFVWLLALLLVGCDGDDRLKEIPGHYEGYVTIEWPSGAASFTRMVSADSWKTSERTLSIRILTEFESWPVEFELERLSKDRLRLTSHTGYLPGPLILQKVADTQRGSNTVFRSASGDQASFDGRELRLILTPWGARGYSNFVVDKMSARRNLVSEDPRVYTVAQLMERAKNSSFDTQAQFEKVIEAKRVMRNAYATGLLPHLNINSILNVVTLSYMSMLHSIGDLVPFILPNHWFHAQAAEAQSQVEFDAYRVVKANAMNIVQGLALSVVRDEQVVDRLKENQVDVIRIRDEILNLEHAGDQGVQVGTSLAIEIVLSAIRDSIDTMNENIKEELMVLSHASGFVRPDAIAGVEPFEAPVVKGPIGGSRQQWRDYALNRSLELLQIDHMVDYEKHSKDERRFQWLDPTGDDAGSLGFGLKDYIAIGDSKIQELNVKRQDTESQVLKKVYFALSQSEDLYNHYRRSLQTSRIDDLQIARLMLNFRIGINFDMMLLVNALEDRIKNAVLQIDAQYTELSLLAQLDLLTFSGPYASFLGDNPSDLKNEE